VRHGAREISVVVTHGLFTGDAWRELFDHGVTVLHTTDSVPGAAARRSARIAVHGVRPLLEDALARGWAG
jgi:ribose-phosphate pyrophosphokinase